jgi:hypothetical protein
VGRQQEEKNKRKTHNPPVVDLGSLVVSDTPSEQTSDNLSDSVHEVEATCRIFRVSTQERSREETGQTDALRLLVLLVPRSDHGDQDRRDHCGEGMPVRTGGRKEKKATKKRGRRRRKEDEPHSKAPRRTRQRKKTPHLAEEAWRIRAEDHRSI